MNSLKQAGKAPQFTALEKGRQFLHQKPFTSEMRYDLKAIVREEIHDQAHTCENIYSIRLNHPGRETSVVEFSTLP